MEFKLTERQSFDILKHLGNFRPLIEKINEEAYDILDRYYEKYRSVPKNYWFKPMSQEKFFTKMCKGSTSIGAYKEFGWKKIIYSYNYAELNFDYLRKFGIGVEPIAHQVVMIALDSPYVNSPYLDVVDNMYNLLIEYSSPPFVVDDKLIEMYKEVKASNEKIIQVLSSLGINYEL